jgi:hypothetical protein
MASHSGCSRFLLVDSTLRVCTIRVDSLDPGILEAWTAKVADTIAITLSGLMVFGEAVGVYTVYFTIRMADRLCSWTQLSMVHPRPPLRCIAFLHAPLSIPEVPQHQCTCMWKYGIQYGGSQYSYTVGMQNVY